MSAEDPSAEQSLMLSVTRGATTCASRVVTRGLHLLQSAHQISRVLARPHVVENSLGMLFILIPEGEFLMGEATSTRPGHLPCHRVTISQPLYLGMYPVTQAQWEAVMGNNPSHVQGRPAHPVEQVSWDDVQQFLHQLNAREDLRTYRLPTEAEWDYACRAGAPPPDDSGDEVAQLTAYGWYGGSRESTQPVGHKLPNAWGVHDMVGNVWEWCHDGRRTSTVEAVVNPLGPTEAGADRVIRGGSWNTPAHGVGERFGFAPDSRYGHIGFRCARSVPSTEPAERVMP